LRNRGTERCFHPVGRILGPARRILGGGRILVGLRSRCLSLGGRRLCGGRRGLCRGGVALCLFSRFAHAAPSQETHHRKRTQYCNELLHPNTSHYFPSIRRLQNSWRLENPPRPPSRVIVTN